MRTGCEGAVSISAMSKLLLSRKRASGTKIRTSHELEGHGDALLIVRHFGGISRELVWSGVWVLV